MNSKEQLINFALFQSLLLIILFCSGLFVEALGKNINEIDLFLAVAICIVTSSFLLTVMLIVFKKYNHFSKRYYLLNPIFVLNGSILLRVYYPYFFQLVSGSYQRNLSIQEDVYLMPMLVISFAILIANVIMISLEEKNISTQEFNLENFSFFHKKQSLLTFLFLFSIAWLSWITQYFVGGYFHAIYTAGQFEVSSSVLGILSALSDRIAPLLWFALSVLYFRGFAKSRRYKIFFWVSLFAHFIFFLPSGSKSDILLPWIFLAMTWAVFNPSKKDKLLLIIAICLLIVFIPIYNTYRTYQNKKFKGNLVSNISFRYYFSTQKSEQGLLYFFLSKFTGRLDHLSSYLVLTKEVPTSYDFIYGNSYLPILTSYIPRVIFPSKPTQLDQNELARKVRLINPNDRTTSIGIMPWGEAYLNFGYIGVVFVFILLALFFHALYFSTFFSTNRISLLKLSFYGFALYWLIVRQSLLLGLFGIIIQAAMIIGLSYILVSPLFSFQSH